MVEIKLCNISKKYGDRQVLKDISIDFFSGMTVILGPSGSGKSTVLNILGCLESPDSGEMLINGEKITYDQENKSDEYRCKMVGFIFQDGNLIHGLTVRQNLNLIMDVDGVTADYKEIAETFGISHLLDNYAETLSGGERQRVSIVRALLKKSEIILADEPTGNLDEENSINVFKELKLCADKYNKTVILVTHDYSKAREFADRIITVQDGKVKEDNVVNNKLPQKNEVKSETGFTKLSMKSILLLAKKNILSKKKKFISIMLIVSVTLSLIALCYDVYACSHIVMNDVNLNYLETDLIEVSKKSNDNISHFVTNIPFVDEDFKYISETEMFNEVVAYCPIDLMAVNGDKLYEILNLRYIYLDDFFKERIMSYDIKGEFIESDDEVIIGKDVAEALFKTDDCVGETLVLTDGTGYEMPVKIKGVNNTLNAEGKYYSYVSSEVSYRFYPKTQFCESIMLCEKDYIDCELKTVFKGGYKGKLVEYNNHELLTGMFPDSDNKIAVDLSLANVILKSTYPDVTLTKENIYQHLDKVSMLFNTDFYGCTTNSYPVNICAILSDEYIEPYTAAVTSNMYLQLNEVYPYRLQCYLKDMDTIKAFSNHRMNAKYNILSKYTHLQVNVGDKTDNFKKVLLSLGLVMMFLSLFMLKSFISMSVTEDKYQIGVIRALGSSRKQIKYVYKFEYFILSCLSSVIAVVIYYASHFTVNSVLDSSYIQLEINMLIPVFMFLISFIITQISCDLSILKLNKIKISDCIRFKC